MIAVTFVRPRRATTKWRSPSHSLKRWVLLRESQTESGSVQPDHLIEAAPLSLLIESAAPAHDCVAHGNAYQFMKDGIDRRALEDAHRPELDKSHLQMFIDSAR